MQVTQKSQPLGSPFYASTLDSYLDRDKLIKMKSSLVS
jgi:hypothetical protein